MHELGSSASVGLKNEVITPKWRTQNTIFLDFSRIFSGVCHFGAEHQHQNGFFQSTKFSVLVMPFGRKKKRYKHCPLSSILHLLNQKLKFQYVSTCIFYRSILTTKSGQAETIYGLLCIPTVHFPSTDRSASLPKTYEVCANLVQADFVSSKY